MKKSFTCLGEHIDRQGAQSYAGIRLAIKN